MSIMYCVKVGNGEDLQLEIEDDLIYKNCVFANWTMFCNHVHNEDVYLFYDIPGSHSSPEEYANAVKWLKSKGIEHHKDNVRKNVDDAVRLLKAGILPKDWD